jgi:hypothetical protein
MKINLNTKADAVMHYRNLKLIDGKVVGESKHSESTWGGYSRPLDMFILGLAWTYVPKCKDELWAVLGGIPPNREDWALIADASSEVKPRLVRVAFKHVKPILQAFFGKDFSI